MSAMSRRRGMRHFERLPGGQTSIWNLGIAAGKVADGGVYRPEPKRARGQMGGAARTSSFSKESRA